MSPESPGGGRTARPVRIGAVSYLNARPLVHGLDHGSAGEEVILSYDVPSALSERMAAGELDVGLLPVIELARMPELEIVPGLGIVTFGAARSVLLVARRPLDQVRRVALDPESCTSNALVRVLFAEAWGVRPSFEVASTDIETALARTDAVVRIGDKALFEPPPPDTRVFDLGEVWTALTGLPFVFAVWAARPDVVDRELYRLLHAARRRGTADVQRIAEEYSFRGRRDPALALAYLQRHIRHRLGAAELRAMNRFFEAAAAVGAIERPPQPRLALTRWSACHETAARAGLLDGRNR